MSAVETMPHAQRATLTKSRRGKESLTNVYQCLVVSESRQRRHLLMRAATDGGWDALVCSDAQSARAEANRTLVQMALVDLEGLGGVTPAGYRPFCESLTQSQKNLLLIVCGRGNDPEEEIWARQAGAWIYLPGVSHGEQLSVLCEEGRKAAEKLVYDKALRAAPVRRR